MPATKLSTLQNNTILTIDDDPTLLMLASEFFSEEGCRVVTASSGAEALAIIHQIAPDMVLLDISMPDMDGYEVCSRIKAIPEFQHTPIIMLSGMEENAALERAYETGACDFISKPVNWSILKHRLSNAMRTSSALINDNRSARLQKSIERSSNNVLTGTFQECSEKEQAQAELHRLAFHDELTGLPNRRGMTERINEHLARAEQTGSRFAVCLLDLDEFEAINVTQGHCAGDKLLQLLSQRLRKLLQRHDVTAREWHANSLDAITEIAHLGGDEFLILLNDITDNSEAASLASRILQEVATPIELDKHAYNLTASLGIAIFPEDGTSQDELLMHADSAMYEVKHKRRNNFAFYTQKTGDRVASRLQLENELRAAINNNELELHYQAQVDSSLQRIVGAEAMLRWRHPVHGLRYPDLFVPLLEESGLILPIGEWVLEQAAAQLNAWSGLFADDFMLSVNVSSVQVQHSSFPKFTRQLLQTHATARGKLVFELTETALLSNTNTVRKNLRDIKAAGVKIAIDDFGTGYSALSYLRDFPIDHLKVDRSFIKDLERNNDEAAIVRVIFSLAKALNLGVTVEGVENRKQLEVMRDIGECQIQGWLVSRALPAQDFENFAKNFAKNFARNFPGQIVAPGKLRLVPKVPKP